MYQPRIKNIASRDTENIVLCFPHLNLKSFEKLTHPENLGRFIVPVLYTWCVSVLDSTVLSHDIGLYALHRRPAIG